MASHRIAAAVVALAALFGLAGSAAAEPRATASLDTRADAIYAGLPFGLTISATGFAETPTPEISAVQISGCQLKLLGVSPRTSTQISIINGNTTRSSEVSFEFQYRTVCSSPGTYTLPAVTLTQQGHTAHTRAASFRVQAVDTSTDMRLAIEVPDRAMWVGESFPIHIDWYLRRQPQDQTFVLPVFASDALTIAPPPGTNQATLTFLAGDAPVELPYQRSDTSIDGIDYTRYRFSAMATAHESGQLTFPPASVVAKLEVGAQRGVFGFRVPQVALFRAESDPVKLKIRPLPLAGQPPSFANAIGSAYSIDVTAGRTVVRVGEPIDLEITVHSKADLTGLRLPELSAMGLSADEVEVIGDSGAGQRTPDNLGVTFHVTARLLKKTVTAVPALSFSFFDPEAGQYRTVTSEPIALKVAGSVVVGADDVVSAQGHPRKKPEEEASSQAPLAGADLTLSAPDKTLAVPLGIGDVWPICAALYVLSVLFLGFRIWQVQTRAHRGAAGAVRAARKEVQRAISRCRHEPARECAGDLLAALTRLGRVAEKPASSIQPLQAKIETAAYAPEARDQPLPASLCDEAAAVAKKLASTSRPARKKSAAAAMVLMAAALTPAAIARAAAATAPDPLATARTAYERGLAATDPGDRRAQLTRAEDAFASAVRAHPGHPALLSDWGTAALAAGDLGTASLAYHRALAIDPGNARARQNLALIAAKIGPLAATATGDAPLDELFFWRDVSPALLHVGAAVAFFVAMILLAPVAASSDRRRILRRLSAIPLALWLALLAPAVLGSGPGNAAVIVAGGQSLRTADSPGAPAASPQPVPAGATAHIIDRRDSWTRVILPTGDEGWLPAHVVRAIAAD